MPRLFLFWHKWLVTVSWLMVGVGYLLTFAPGSIMFDYYNHHLSRTFWQIHALPENVSNFHHWALGISGAVMAGWGVLYVFVVQGPYKRREPWAWKALVWSFLAWFPFDTAVSLYYKFTLNAFINVLFLILFTLPLFSTRSFFKE